METKCIIPKIFYVNQDNILHEAAQSKRDFVSEKRHFANKEVYDKKNDPKIFRPLEGELIDYLSPIDVIGGADNRKLSSYWDGVYVVRTVFPHCFTACIEKLDMSSMKPVPSTKRKVHLGSCRPSLMVHRPLHDFSPDWMQQ